ncbi:MAG: response regulator [Candidatus Omnitrophota bacterium]
MYLLRALLQGHGYEVSAASNGVEALDMARQDPPDLIISDILMPAMDGFALCREWNNDWRRRMFFMTRRLWMRAWKSSEKDSNLNDNSAFLKKCFTPPSRIHSRFRTWQRYSPPG